ncbi:MAG TPA: hypothetical protein VLL52_22435 [Anaerolineae bacterium]|nr:hypothetical protein [Anaerolineae bacterium]
MISSQSDENNPIIPGLLRIFTAIEVGVLFIAGGGLFFLPTQVQTLWPWEVAPFNMRLLGAIYLASLVATFFVVAVNRWSPSRVVVPMILVFTFVILIISLIYIDRFDGPIVSIGLWFLLYVTLPVNAAYHLWVYREQFLKPLPRLAPPVRIGLLLQVIILGLYGLGLLVAPNTFSAFWPWSIDAFHGQMYSVAYISLAIGAYMLWRGVGPFDLPTLSITQTVLGSFTIIGLIVVDLSANRVDWSAFGTWLWIGLFASLTLFGLFLLTPFVHTVQKEI